MKQTLAACLVSTLSLPCVAQATILVGPGGLPEITDAIAIANSGDTILVAPGTYSWFAFSAALTIRAITPGTVTVSPHPVLPIGPIVTFVNGGTATLVGLNMTGLWCVRGRFVVDQCTMIGANPLDCQQGTMHLQRCTLRVVTSTPGFASVALKLLESHVTAIDSTFEAALGWGKAIELTGGSTFHGSRVTLDTLNQVALHVATGCKAWLVDAALTTDPSRCPILGTTGRMQRTTLAPNCGALPTGPVLGVSRPRPLQVGQPFVLDFQAQPHETVEVFASSGLARTLVPGLEQALLLDPMRTWSAFVLTADAQGAAPMTWNVPAQSSLVNASLWFQGVGFASVPLQASPVAGGVIR
jgi:hypothetical protein